MITWTIVRVIIHQLSVSETSLSTVLAESVKPSEYSGHNHIVRSLTCGRAAHGSMSKKIQTGVIIMLLAGKKFVFEDIDTIAEIYGLGPNMFMDPNEFVSDKERESIRSMLDAVERGAKLKDKYDILEGKRLAAFVKGRAALTKWFRGQRVSNALLERIDAVWDKLDLLPLQMIQELPHEGFPDVRDADPAKEDIALAIWGDRALSITLRGEFREGLAPIIHHNWERHRKRYTRASDTMGAKRLDAITKCKGEQGSVRVITVTRPSVRQS